MTRVRELSEEMVRFWTEPHLCTVTSLRADGSPHVVPLGVVLDAEHRVAWAITTAGTQKAVNLARDPRVAACQVDRGRWASIEGSAQVLQDADSVTEAVRRYAQRYKQPRHNPQRVAVRIEIQRVIGNL